MPAFDAIGMDAVGVNSQTASQAASAPGATISGAGTITGGAATGAAAGTAPGASLSATGTISGGSATGNASTSAPAASLTGVGSVSGGQASAASSAPGTSITGGGAISAGAASAVIPPLPVNPRMLYIAGSMMNFHPKRTAEREVFTVDFSPILAPGETVVSAAWSITAVDGNDANAGAMVSGEARPNGALVSQFIMAGVPGVIYAPVCTAQTSDGQALLLPEYGAGLLEVTL